MLWHGKNFRGILTKAKEMIFDNTGTNLISTNAEDAIKEVNSNLSQNKIKTSSENLSLTQLSTGVTGEVVYQAITSLPANKRVIGCRVGRQINAIPFIEYNQQYWAIRIQNVVNSTISLTQPCDIYYLDEV